jgi:hypothetical protein
MRISLLYGIVFKLQTLVVDVSLFKGARGLERITALVIAIFFEHGYILSHSFIDIGSIAIQQQSSLRHIIIPCPFELRVNQIIMIEPKFLFINNMMSSESSSYPMPVITLQGSIQNYDLKIPYPMF